MLRGAGGAVASRRLGQPTTRRAQAVLLWSAWLVPQLVFFSMASGEPVMALGGFSGGDRILTPAQLQARVAAGEVRFFLLAAGDQQARQQAQLVRWIESRCARVPPSQWQAAPTPPPPQPIGPTTRELWDCAT
jgi:4-amino-4-deoxy-L-arabinose transferase-like glycosyltransferase